MTTAIIHHPVFREHDTGPNHPETPSRYSVVMDALRGDQQLWGSLLEVEAKEAPRGDIQAAHSPQLYKLIERVVAEGSGILIQTQPSRCVRSMPHDTRQARRVRPSI